MRTGILAFLLQVTLRILEQPRACLAVEEKLVDLPDILFSDLIPARCFSDDAAGGEHLDGVPEACPGPNATEGGKAPLTDCDALHGSTDRHDLHHLLDAVGHGPHDEHPIEQIHGYSVGRKDIGSPDVAHAPVGGEDDNGREGGLEGPVEEGEALRSEGDERSESRKGLG